MQEFKDLEKTYVQQLGGRFLDISRKEKP